MSDHRWTITFTTVGKSDPTSIVARAESLAKAMRATPNPDSDVIVSAIPTEEISPRDWVQFERGRYTYVRPTGYGGGEIKEAHARKAASLFRSECFGAMLFANAIGGGPSEEWALVHAGFTPEELDAIALRLAP